MGSEEAIRAIVESLDLARHPEGGWYRRTWTASTHHGAGTGRATASAILYLLGAGDRSAWHRLTDAEEVWMHQDGDPLDLHVSPDGRTERIVVLGPLDVPDAVPTTTLPIGAWQSAEVGSTADGDGQGWSLVTCVVSPEFRFEHFELAPPCWEPGGNQV